VHFFFHKSSKILCLMYLKPYPSLVKTKKKKRSGCVNTAQPFKTNPQAKKPVPDQQNLYQPSGKTTKLLLKIAEAKARELGVGSKDEHLKFVETRRGHAASFIDLERKAGALEDRELRLKRWIAIREKNCGS